MTTVKFEGARVTQEYGGDTWLALRVEDGDLARRLCDKVNSAAKPFVADVKQYREKRSLDANAYAWALIGKIANVLRANKDDVYLEMLKSYGQTGVVKIPDNMRDNVLRSIKYWEPHEKLPPEEKAQYYRVWVGSSQYDTEEMSIFIDGIISECKELGIETATPEEQAKMMSLWEQERSAAS